jgi:hypothetical protein
MGSSDELLEVFERAVGRVDGEVVADVVAVVALGRRERWQQPDRADAQVLDVVELLDQPAEVADAVGVAVVEGLDGDLIEDRVLVPEGIRASREAAGRTRCVDERVGDGPRIMNGSGERGARRSGVGAAGARGCSLLPTPRSPPRDRKAR